MSFCTVCLPDSPDLFGDINAYRAPRDAAAATNTARSLKLIDPGCQFVSHPLPVARESGRPYSTSMDVRMRRRETRVPPPPALGMITGEIRYLFDGTTEARRADHCAIRTGQTAGGNIIPTRMIHVSIEQFLDA